MFPDPERTTRSPAKKTRADVARVCLELASEAASLSWGEVAFSGAGYVAAVVAVEIDGPECAVGFEVRGDVGQRVLAAQLFLDVFEAVGHLLDGGREEDLSAGVLRELREHLVAFAAAGRPVGADGVDDGFGALAHLDGFIEVDAALVVVAVRDEDHGLADRLLPAGCVEQLVAAGGVDGVEHRGAAAGAEAIDAGFERIDVVGPVGGNIGSDVESHDKGAVASAPSGSGGETRWPTAARTGSACGWRCWHR